MTGGSRYKSLLASGSKSYWIEALKMSNHMFSMNLTCSTNHYGTIAQILNGKGSLGLKITKEMVGHKFGNFNDKSFCM